MPTTKSATKMMGVNERRRQRNRSVKSATHTLVSKAVKLVQGAQPDEAKGAVIQAMGALDKAAQKRVIHRNNAARRKSRLMKKLNEALASKEG